ncbi:(d)CMP kinase [Opitutia bacterium ISCC 51]|nr:(d)CMP kinase [Opitutae bacterium ISCC 51]QXD28361.1 (d)CMP kinase [Opitutae bacterium ISCC 52]
MGKSFILVTVDGGAASGKSSTSKILSERLKLLYVNTGSHYRSLTWAVLQAGIQPEDDASVSAYLETIPIGAIIEGREARITLESKVLGDEIRSEAVNNAVSIVAAIPEVRQFLLRHQRGYADLAKESGFDGLIMEGRDIGSIIFPDADFRFFMFADEAERARRRALEGQVDSIQKRDQLDKQRKTAPLTCPEGAIKIDTTHLTLEKVAQKMQDIVQIGNNMTNEPHKS